MLNNPWIQSVSNNQQKCANQSYLKDTMCGRFKSNLDVQLSQAQSSYMEE